MDDAVKCFFAYPSKPVDLGETLQLAIQQINNGAVGVVEAIDWGSLRIGGRVIIDVICRKIEECEVFACDLTYLNANVLFELGYAIARNKRIWISLDTSIKGSAENYRRFSLVAGVGFREYQNARQLASTFLSEAPFQDLEETIYARTIRLIEQSGARPPHVLYLKCPLDTESSVQLARRLGACSVKVVADDPKEMSSQHLAWYVENVQQAVAVVAHLVDDRRRQSAPYNQRYSFVCGIAQGLGKRTLMLAHRPFTSPIDYRELLKIHSTASECRRFIDAWLPDIETMYSQQRQRYEQAQKQIQVAHAFARVSLGEALAENEQSALSDYFVETAQYREALRTSGSLIFIGRKGTGKTANLIKIQSDLAQDRRCHVCVIKPPDYELGGVRRLFALSQEQAERGYLAQSLWKFLIYTELARSACQKIKSGAGYLDTLPGEEELVQFVDQNQALIGADFTVRMERALDDLCGLDFAMSVTHQRTRVSEILHENILPRLRELLGNSLGQHRKVIVLVDNLDKAWLPNSDLTDLCELIFGLLGACREISEYFSRGGVSWKRVPLSAIVFLRSDIFWYIMRHAREKDKVPVQRMDWTDTQLLERIIEERFCSSLGETLARGEVWERFFAPTVRGVPAKQFILSHIIPRPRDIIYVCKAALASACNHQHGRIEEDDIVQGQQEYSQYLLDSVVVEGRLQLSTIEDLLYEFAGEEAIISRDRVGQLAAQVKIPASDLSFVISFLCDLTFLGLETAPGEFQYIYDESRKNLIQSLSRKHARETGEQRFRVNPAFHSFLGITGN